jgi:hypothetical protein
VTAVRRSNEVLKFGICRETRGTVNKFLFFLLLKYIIVHPSVPEYK